MADKDYSQMSDDELIQAASKAGVSVKKPTKKPEEMSDDELIQAASEHGIAPEQPPITEANPKKTAHGFDLGLMANQIASGAGALANETARQAKEMWHKPGEALGGFGSVAGQGFLDGAQELDSTMSHLHDAIIPFEPHIAAKFDAEDQAVIPKLKEAIGGKKTLSLMQNKYPGTSDFVQGVGSFVPQAPVFEAGAGAAGGAMKVVGKGLAATGPLGAKMLSFAQQMPGATTALSTIKQMGGAFTTNLMDNFNKEERGNQGKPPNLIEVVQKTLDDTAKQTPGIAIANTLFHGAAKLKVMRDQNIEKARQDQNKLWAQQQKQQFDQQAAQLEEHQQQAKNRVQQAQAHQDMMEKIQAHREADIKERQQALDEQKARLKELERQQQLKQKAAVEQQVQKQLSLTAKRKGNASSLGPKKPTIVPPEASPEEQAAIDQLKADIAKRREEVLAARKAHAAAITQEIAEMRKGGGDPTHLEPPQASQPQEAPPQKAPTPPPPKESESGGTGSHHEPVEEFTADEAPKESPQDEAFHRKNWSATLKQLGIKRKQPKGQTTHYHIDGNWEKESHVLNQNPDLKLLHDLSQAEAAGKDALDQFVKENPDAEAAAAEIRKKGQMPILLEGFTGGPAQGAKIVLATLKDMWKNREYNYNDFMTKVGVAKTSDLFALHDKDLAESFAKAGMKVDDIQRPFANFKRTAGKLNFAQGGAGGVDQEVINKALRLRGDVATKLNGPEFANLSQAQKKALLEANGHVQDFLKEANKVNDWLKANKVQDLPDGAGLKRLQETLSHYIKNYQGEPPSIGPGDKRLMAGTSMLQGGIATGRFNFALVHAAGKAVVLGAQNNPVGLLSAAAKATANKTFREFNKVFWEHSQGAVTEAMNDNAQMAPNLVKKASNAVGKVLDKADNMPVVGHAMKALSGRSLEQTATNTASVLGLERAAKKLGYKNGEELAQQILDARNGKGPLASNKEKLWNAMEAVTNYVTDTTGTNVPGFRDETVWQRNRSMRLGSLMMNAATIESRNVHLMVRNVIASKTPGELAKNATVLAAAGAGLYIAAGDKGPMFREFEHYTRGAVGDRNWYKGMDYLHAARQAAARFGIREIPHLSPAFSPVASGSQMTYQEEVRNTARDLQSQDPEKRNHAIVRALTIAGVNTLGGKLGMGMVGNYMDAADEARKGFETVKTYRHGAVPGIEEHVGDTNAPIDTIHAFANRFLGGESAEQSDINYLREKSQDLMKYTENAAPQMAAEGHQAEREIENAYGLTSLKQDASGAMALMKEAGIKPDSDQYRHFVESIKRQEAQIEPKVLKARASLWQHIADGVQEKPPVQQQQSAQELARAQE